MIRLLLACAAVLLLAGCKSGGSSGSPSEPPAPPTPPTRDAPLWFGYYGVTSRRDLEETADHVDLAWIVDLWFGDPTTPAGRAAIADRIVATLQDAKALGIRRAIIGVAFLTFEGKHYLGTSELILFKKRLYDAGLLDLVYGLTIFDEPDTVPITDEVLRAAFADCRAVWQGAKIAVIYSNSGGKGRPGIAEADLIGVDDYDAGTGILTQLPALHGAQRYLVIPGGCDPWRADPGPFCAFALAHAEVAGVLAFRYFDHADGPGIRSNGMADAYRAVGGQIKATFA